MSLLEHLDAFKADFEGGKLACKPSPQVLDIMHRATAELIASGQSLHAKKAEDKAPEFTLKDSDGQDVSLAELLAKGPVVAISPQTAPNSRRSQRDNSLTFPILSDEKSRVAAAFGLRFSLTDYLVELDKGLKNDLPAFNDDPAWVLPMPARYMIGFDSVIAYAEVNPDYTQRPDRSELLPVLDKLRATSAA